jgi:hypothetical protein
MTKLSLRRTLRGGGGLTPCSCLYHLESTRNDLAMAVLWPWRARSERRYEGGIPEPVQLGKAALGASVFA